MEIRYAIGIAFIVGGFATATIGQSMFGEQAFATGVAISFLGALLLMASKTRSKRQKPRGSSTRLAANKRFNKRNKRTNSGGDGDSRLDDKDTEDGDGGDGD